MVHHVEVPSQRHSPVKKWGWEEWIVNNDLYCGKRLHFTIKDGATSMHFHAKKHETMYVESGAFQITLINTADGSKAIRCLGKGGSLVIPPMTPHRICAVSVPSVLVEFSTHHEDSDSYRVEP